MGRKEREEGEIQHVVSQSDIYLLSFFERKGRKRIPYGKIHL